MAFEPITTQEKLDEIISARLTREREATAKKYADYDDIKADSEKLSEKIKELERERADLTKKYEGYDTQILDLQKKCKDYEAARKKTDIALEYGIPYGMASRLRGESDEEIRKDAQEMLGMMRSGRKPKAPEQSDDAGKGNDSKTAAYTQLLNDLNIGGN